MEFLCLDFANNQLTNSHTTQHGSQRDETWLKQLCTKWQLPDIPVSDATWDTLVAAQNFMREALLELTVHAALSEQTLQRLNGYLESAHVHYRVETPDGTPRLCIVPGNFDINWTVFKIALSLSELITAYPLERLKECNNPECGWFFYDESKSKTKKWCDNKCASLIKVRQFRKKARQAKAKHSHAAS